MKRQRPKRHRRRGKEVERRGAAEAPPPLPLPLLPLLPLLLCVPAGPGFEGTEKMPLQGVYGEHTPRSGAPQHSGSHSPCAGQCVTRDHCEAAARLPRVCRRPPAPLDRPARVGHARPAPRQRNLERSCCRQRRARGKKRLPRQNRWQWRAFGRGGGTGLTSA